MLGVVLPIWFAACDDGPTAPWLLGRYALHTVDGEALPFVQADPMSGNTIWWLDGRFRLAANDSFEMVLNMEYHHQLGVQIIADTVKGKYVLDGSTAVLDVSSRIFKQTWGATFSATRETVTVSRLSGPLLGFRRALYP